MIARLLVPQTRYQSAVGTARKEGTVGDTQSSSSETHLAHIPFLHQCTLREALSGLSTMLLPSEPHPPPEWVYSSGAFRKVTWHCSFESSKRYSALTQHRETVKNNQCAWKYAGMKRILTVWLSKEYCKF
jgi:hypothetical protein